MDDERQEQMTSSLSLAGKIEAVLFHRGDSMTITELAAALSTARSTVLAGLDELKEHLAGRGIRLFVREEEVQLVTSPEASALISKMVRDEREKDLTKASLEALSIILYKKGASRADIEFIRGVNSSYILKNLLLRGLVEKRTDRTDRRKTLYVPSTDLLLHLGVQEVEDLPQYSEVQAKITQAVTSAQEHEEEE